MMKILLIAQEPPLSPDTVVTGNSIRNRQLSACLESAGHEVVHVWRDPKRSDPDRTFRDRDDLRGLLMRQRADIHLVSYWELLDLMPFETETPLVLDFLAPRPLEQLFEEPDHLRRDLRRLQVDLSKVDLLLTGNELQRAMMMLPLLEAGLDLSREAGVVVVPLGGETTGTPLSDPLKEGWKLVSGGVDWPWRKADRYWAAIEGLPAQPGASLELVLFGGEYALRSPDPDGAIRPARVNPLMPYREFSAWLSDHAHIGLELADENTERQFSQSFRSVEFLRHGLPLICNRYLPMARHVEQYDAGWLVDTPDDLADLLPVIMADPEAWRAKSDNASRLAREVFCPERTCAPLLAWLQAPRQAARLPRQLSVEPELAVPPWRERLRRMRGMRHHAIQRRMASLRRRVHLPQVGWRKYTVAPVRAWYALVRAWHYLRVLFIAPVFFVQRLVFGGRKGDGVVVITRSDLFPADHGAAVKIVETARGFSKLDVPVALVTDEADHWYTVERGEVIRHRVPWWIRAMSLPGNWYKALHYSKDIPQSNAFLYLPLTDGSFFWRTLYAGKRVGARALQAEFPAYVRPGIHASHVLDARLVLVEHNVEYDRIRSQVEELTEDQYQRYKAIEVDLCNQCDAVICVSDNDRQKLAEDGVELDRLYTVPHGVDLEQFDLPPKADMREQLGIPERAPVLVYHGTFSYPPNLQALGVFANELLPRLDQLGLECHVLAVGREPPDVSPHPRIHLTGSVDKVGPWIKSADLAVVPLLDGGGTRMKIIDCFAAGTAVLSTAKGIEGIPVINGRHALVIDDWDEMAAAIKRLVEQPQEAARLAAEAKAMAESMDWKSIAAAYLDIFDALPG